VNKQPEKNSAFLKCLVALVLLTGLSTTSVAAVIYTVDRTVDLGRITGSIETNGTTGVLTSADIIDWNLTIDADGDPVTSGQLLGPISGNNSSITFLDGSPLTATPTELFFDFSLPDAILQIATPGGDVVWQLQAGVFSDELIQEAFIPGTGPIQAFAMHPPAQQQIATTGVEHDPVTYSYITGDAPFGGELAPLFAGQSVSGTFVYDRDAPIIGMTTTGGSPGSAIYAPAIMDLAGSIAGNSFSDPNGSIVVGDDKFLPFGGADILVLVADPAIGTVPPAFINFSGFDIDGFTLINVRLFWIEGLPSAGDFLSDQNLPAILPDFPGRLALDFVPTGTTEPVSSVFFDLLRVSPPIMVTIDIKPRSTRNPINPFSRGKIPVAILSTDTFDATQVDVSTVAFGPDGAAVSHGRSFIKDIDYDGDMDLILLFNTQDTGILCGDTEATLTGETFDGVKFSGSDSIKTVGCKPRNNRCRKRHGDDCDDDSDSDSDSDSDGDSDSD